MLDLSFLSLKSIVADGRDKFHGAVLQKIQQQYVQYTEYCIDDLGYSGENKIGEYHNKLADTHRESLSNGGSLNSQGMTLENLSMFSQPAFAHIVFIEKYTARLNTPPKKIKPESNTSLKTEFSEFMTLTPVPGDKEKLVKEAMVVKPRIIKDLTMSNISMDEDKETKNTDKELVESNSRIKTLEEDDVDHFSDMFTDRVPALEAQVDIPNPSGPPELRISEGSIPESLRPDASKGALHLVVFVHGYEGCSFDMKLMKNMFCFVAKSHLVFHSAIANETDSSEDIGLQGKKLAAEIIDLIKFNFKPEELKG